MVHHLELGPTIFSRKRKLVTLIRKDQAVFAGNKKLKIYGKLSCKSGKRMKPENRVFFHSEDEAISLGFRACLHCMRLNLTAGISLPNS